MPTRLETLELIVSKRTDDPFPMYGLALEYRSNGRNDDAIRTFEQLRTKFPNYVPQYLMCGQLLEKLGRRDDAREWFQAGLVVARASRDHHAAGELESALAGVS